MNIDLSNLTRRWTRAGAFFNAPSANESPDLEQLVLDSARAAGEDPRLFIMALSWLAQNGQLIRPDRLAKLVAAELELEYLPNMGLLLDLARQYPGCEGFDQAIALCSPAPEPQPLFDVERMNPTLQGIAERNASEVSRRWNRLVRPFDLKPNAIRPLSWILAMNPTYRCEDDVPVRRLSATDQPRSR